MVKALIKNSTSLFRRQHNTILSAALVIAASYAGSAILGLVRNRLLASHFFGGLESHLDVYFAAFVLPDTIFQLLVVGALSAAFIPVYASYLKKGDKQANQLVNATLSSLFLIMAILSAILFVFAKPASTLIAHFPEKETILMANLMRIMLVSQIFFTLSTFLTGIIQTHQRFLVPAIAPLFYNLGIIIGIIFLAPSIGIYGPAVGVVLGSLLHAVVQFPLAHHLGFRLRFYFSPKHKGVVTIRRLMIPRTLALGAAQAERWVAIMIATLLSAGSLSLFNFARSLYLMPISLFGVSLGQASFPRLSQQASGFKKIFKKTISHTLLQLFFFALPSSMILLVLRIPVVRIVFGAKSFPWEATLLTAKTLAIFAISIAPQAASHVVVRAFYALKDTKTPLYISVASIIVSIILSYYLAITLDLGIVGLALALTISNTLGFLWLIAALQKRIGRLYIYLSTPKILIATLFTGGAFWFAMRFLDQFVFDTTRTLPLVALTVIAGTLGMIVYFFFCYLLRVEELGIVFRLTRKLGNWRNLLTKSDELLEQPPTDPVQ